MGTLLVCVDFSEATSRLIEQAARLAGAAGERIVLLHVAEPDPDFVGYGAGPDVVRHQMADQYRREIRLLEELADGLREKADVGDVLPLVVQGSTAEKILSEADKLGASMILLGTHGHGKLYHLLMGCVSQQVLKEAKVPVLLVPREGGLAND